MTWDDQKQYQCCQRPSSRAPFRYDTRRNSGRLGDSVDKIPPLDPWTELGARIDPRTGLLVAFGRGCICTGHAVQAGGLLGLPAIRSAVSRSDPMSSSYYYGLTLPSVDALSSAQGPLFSIPDRLTILGWLWAVALKCGVRHRSGRLAWVDPDRRGRLDVIGSAAVAFAFALCVCFCFCVCRMRGS